MRKKTLPWERRIRRAEEIVETLRAHLPDAVREASAGVAVRLDRRVPPAFLDEGVERNTLGLFSGPSLRDPDGGWCEEAPLVSLFTENIWDICDGDESAYEDEVRRTFLHELGHFLGLEEEDMAPRGLD